jgi:hypothetical protein
MKATYPYITVFLLLFLDTWIILYEAHGKSWASRYKRHTKILQRGVPTTALSHNLTVPHNPDN